MCVFGSGVGGGEWGGGVGVVSDLLFERKSHVGGWMGGHAEECVWGG